MSMTILKGQVSARLVQDGLPMAVPNPPTTQWLELLVGGADHGDYVRIWPVEPDALDALGAALVALAEQERQRQAELLSRRQNLREDHRGEVSPAPEEAPLGGLSSEDFVRKLRNDWPER